MIGEAMGGIRHLTADPPGTVDLPSVRTGISLADSLAAMYAVIGLLAGVYNRDVARRNDRRTADVALYEAVFSRLEGCLPEYGKLGVVREQTGSTLPTNAAMRTWFARIWRASHGLVRQPAHGGARRGAAAPGAAGRGSGDGSFRDAAGPAAADRFGELRAPIGGGSGRVYLFVGDPWLFAALLRPGVPARAAVGLFRRHAGCLRLFRRGSGSGAAR